MLHAFVCVAIAGIEGDPKVNVCAFISQQKLVIISSIFVIVLVLLHSKAQYMQKESPYAL